MTRASKTVHQYQLADHLYDIDEKGVFGDLFNSQARVVPGQSKLQGFDALRRNIRNQVIYHFVKPTFYSHNIDDAIKGVMDALLNRLQIRSVDIIDYQELKNLKDSLQRRHVLIHVIKQIKEVAERETKMFDVFVIYEQSSAETTPPGYISEVLHLPSGRQLTILTKDIEGQIAEGQGIPDQQTPPQPCIQTPLLVKLATSVTDPQTHQSSLPAAVSI